ncbi:hypothetical protein LDENG_00293820 [Lucifuga dentata]|nr:hypothetical protein LDENG_00293820 [Lucifuga dentata]
MNKVWSSSASASVSMATGPGSAETGYCRNEPPAFVRPPHNTWVRLGDDARLEGKATNQAGSRQVTVEIILEENAGKKYVLPSSMKTRCSAAPQVENRPGVWSDGPPEFITKPSGVSVRTGQIAKFSAKSKGRPQPRVTWFKGEAELQSSLKINMYEHSGLHFLEIKEVQLEDAGSYTCMVTSMAGTSSASAELSVQGEKTDHQPANGHVWVLGTVQKDFHMFPS